MTTEAITRGAARAGTVPSPWQRVWRWRRHELRRIPHPPNNDSMLRALCTQKSCNVAHDKRVTAMRGPKTTARMELGRWMYPSVAMDGILVGGRNLRRRRANREGTRRRVTSRREHAAPPTRQEDRRDNSMQALPLDG